MQLFSVATPMTAHPPLQRPAAQLVSCIFFQAFDEVQRMV